MNRPLNVAVYARISQDREGRELGVDRQVPDAKALAERLGWRLHPTGKNVFIDNDVSASTKSRKPRPAFNELLAGVRSGLYDGIVYYSTSRLTRRPREYEDVIELVEDTGVRLASCVMGMADLTTADGRMIARMLAAQDAAEAERIGERVSRAFVQRREMGLPHGGERCFGRKSGNIEVEPAEADAIRLGCKMLLDGHSLGDVRRAWLELGVRPPRGGVWKPETVRRTLLKPSNAGLIAHKGEILGPGKMEAIIDPETLEKVTTVLTGRSHLVQARYTGRENLLAGFIWCGVCGNRMKVLALRDGAGGLKPTSHVACLKDRGGCGHVKRNLRFLEEYVFAVLERRLADVRPHDPDDQSEEAREYARLAADRATVEAKVEKLRQQYEQDPDFDAEDFVPMQRRLRTRLREIEAAMAALAPPPSPSDLGEEARAMWASGDFDERRAVLEAFIAQVILRPIGKVGPVRARTMVPETTDVIFN